jgi:hypothetical protein
LPFLTLRRRAAKAYFTILRKQRCAEILLSAREGRVPPCEPPSFSWACRAHTRPGLSESPRTPLTAKACGPGPVFAFVLRSAAGQPRKLRACFSCLAPVGDAQAKSRAVAPPLPPRRRFRLISYAEQLRFLSVARHLGGSPFGRTGKRSPRHRCCSCPRSLNGPPICLCAGRWQNGAEVTGRALRRGDAVSIKKSSAAVFALNVV